MKFPDSRSSTLRSPCCKFVKSNSFSFITKRVYFIYDFPQHFLNPLYSSFELSPRDEKYNFKISLRSLYI